MQSFGDYFGHVQVGLDYFFDEVPTERFIRKTYMSAGTDAHGDFNYEVNIEASRIGRANVSSNAFGLVRTYTLVHERPDADVDPAIAVNAFRDGNTVLTDGPLCKYNLDSDGRHNPDANPRWHDFTTEWENAEGRIGGMGTYDGDLTVLVPLPGDDAWMQSRWIESETPNAGPITTYEMYRITEDDPLPSPGIPDFSLPTGSEGELFEQQLPIALDEVMALIMRGEATVDEQCITNPVWVVPVNIEIQHPEICPIPIGGLTATFHFPISMRNQPTNVFVRPLDANGDSTNPEIALQASPGWELDINGVANGRYTATNSQSAIPCPADRWDAINHIPPAVDLRSYVVYMTSPTELHSNTLNDIGRTIVVPEPDALLQLLSGVAGLVCIGGVGKTRAQRTRADDDRNCKLRFRRVRYRAIRSSRTERSRPRHRSAPGNVGAAAQ
jgi:hypothetical protein